MAGGLIEGLPVSLNPCPSTLSYPCPSTLSYPCPSTLSYPCPSTLSYQALANSLPPPPPPPLTYEDAYPDAAKVEAIQELVDFWKLREACLGGGGRGARVCIRVRACVCVCVCAYVCDCVWWR